MPVVLPLLAVAFALGLVVASQGLGHQVQALVVASFALLGLLLPTLRRRPQRLLVLVVLVASASGVATLSGRLPRDPPCSVRRLVGRRWQRLEIVAVGRAQPRRGGGLRQRVRAAWLHSSLADGGEALCGNVQLTLAAGLPALRLGEHALLRARLRAADTGRNPGSATFLRHLLLRGIVARAHASPGRVLPLGRRPAAGFLARLRGRVRRALHRVPGRARSILAALVLGERGTLDPTLRAQFARSGLGHLLAVSGLHLSLVALGLLAGLTWVLRRCQALTARGDPRRWAALLAFAAALLYTLLTGAAPPTVRACVMTGLLLLALLAQRAPDFLRPLAAAALLLLVVEPLNLFRPAFQLSFAAVVGLVLALSRPRVRGWLWAEGRSRGVLARWGRWLLGLSIVSAAASLATAPLVARHFGSIPVLGVFSNLLAVPLTTFVLLPAALLGALLGALSPALGEPLLAVAGWAAEGLARLAETIAAQPGAALTVSLGWLSTLAGLAVVLALLTDGLARRLAGLTAACLLLVRLVQAALPTPLVVTFLDVGQGDSTLLQLPDGAVVLVDAGGCEPGAFDPGERYVVPALRALGVRKLDLLVLTHPHADHVGGAKAVLEQVEVGEVWACWHAQPNAWIERIRRWSARRHVPLSRPRPWRHGATRLLPLWPQGTSGSCGDPALGTNDNSIVLRVEQGEHALLLSGDIEDVAEGALVEQRAALAAAVLKVPHHGSATSSTESWLDAVGPRLAVISSGRGNRFGLPHARVVRRYRRRRIELWRIDRRGALRLLMPARGPLEWQPAHSLFR